MWFSLRVHRVAKEAYTDLKTLYNGLSVCRAALFRGFRVLLVFGTFRF